MSFRIGIDLQHCGKTFAAVNDLGCFAYSPSGPANEYEYLSQYGLGIQLTLNEQPSSRFYFKTFLLGAGSYKERAEYWNNVIDPDLVILCHVNCGGGNYGAVFYDHRTISTTPVVAKEYARLMSTNLNWEQKVFKTSDNARVFATMKHLRPPALLLEPFFLDNKKHKEAVDLIHPLVFGRIIGESISEAITKVG